MHALIPCAGSGSRLAGEVPKQYREVAGRAIVAHTVRAFLDCAEIDDVTVVVRAGDPHIHGLLPADPRLRIAEVGGATRAESVAGGLRWLADGGVAGDDWVLVHDAARCCITPEAIAALVRACATDPVGGLLALPLPDTLKRGDAAARVEATVPRDGLWLAQTPQMFRLAALLAAIDADPDVTDEASAMERAGARPLLVTGSASNFKVTYPADLELAAAMLEGRRMHT